MSLYLKYRPKTLAEVKGNDEIVSALTNMLKDTKKCPHVFLLHGPTGCGKTTLGRIIAEMLGCVGNDYKEVDSGQFRGIDTVREIRNNCQFMPLEGTCRVWLIDECHKLTGDAQNAFLKILEDTPLHVYFILCTTEPNKLLSTIKGRCSSFQVKKLEDQQLTALIRKVAREEGESLERKVIEQIVQDSFGHPRNALQILEQVLNVPEEERLATATKAAEETTQSIELCRALIRKAKWKEISSILNGLISQDPEEIRRHVLGYCQSILLKEDNMLCGLIMEEMMNPFYNSGMPGLVWACYSITKNQ